MSTLSKVDSQVATVVCGCGCVQDRGKPPSQLVVGRVVRQPPKRQYRRGTGELSMDVGADRQSIVARHGAWRRLVRVLAAMSVSSSPRHRVTAQRIARSLIGCSKALQGGRAYVLSHN
jgi:hypothetical protein